MSSEQIILAQATLEKLVTHVRHMELMGKEGLFGTEDLLVNLEELRRYLERIRERERKSLLGDYKMNIEFENFIPTYLTFSMVEFGQLFVDVDGNLCQKQHEDEDGEAEYAWVICDPSGCPDGRSVTFYSDEKISKLLPKIKRISF